MAVGATSAPPPKACSACLYIVAVPRFTDVPAGNRYRWDQMTETVAIAAAVNRRTVPALLQTLGLPSGKFSSK